MPLSLQEWAGLPQKHRDLVGLWLDQMTRHYVQQLQDYRFEYPHAMDLFERSENAFRLARQYLYGGVQTEVYGEPSGWPVERVEQELVISLLWAKCEACRAQGDDAAAFGLLSPAKRWHLTCYAFRVAIEALGFTWDKTAERWCS